MILFLISAGYNINVSCTIFINAIVYPIIRITNKDHNTDDIDSGYAFQIMWVVILLVYSMVVYPFTK
jgi:hypothetical protein